VALRQHLRWFDERPLFGKKIVVTRSREQAGELVELLESLGAETIGAPMIRIIPPDDYGPLDRATSEAGTYDWIVFTSTNGVEAFMRRLKAGDADVRELKGVKLVAIGPATADHLAFHGVKADLAPVESRAEAVVQALREQGSLKGKKFLLPRADIAREVLADELRKAGAEVTEVTAYRTVLAEIEREGDPDIYRMLLEKRIDVVTFTSASTVKNFVKVFGAEQAPDLLRTTTVASIGPVTAEAAEHVCSRRVEQVVTVKAQRTQVFHSRQAGGGTTDFGERDCPVKCDYGGRRERVELVVERQYGVPVRDLKARRN